MSGWAAGVFTRARNWVTDKAGAINPQAAQFDQEDDNFAGGLNNCVTKDGLNKPSATMDWNNQRLTNLAAATARVDAIQTAQVQDGGPLALSAVAGTDTITGSLTPAITAYANLMRVSFIPAATNTGAATLNVNGVAARSVVKTTGVALVAGDLVSGVPASAIYDLANTRWVLQTNVKVPDASLSSNVPLLNASNTFTGVTQTVTGASAIWQATDGAVQVFLRATAASTEGRSGTFSNHDFTFYTNSLARFTISAAGNFDFKAGTVTTNNASASEVGYKGVPIDSRTADFTVTAAMSGRNQVCTSVADDVTVQASGAPVAGSIVFVENGIGSNINIVQGAGMTLFLAGTATTGSRVLAANSQAYIRFTSASAATVGGVGVS